MSTTSRLYEQGYRKALITGASSGIGLALKDKFVQEGLEVIGISRRPIKAEGCCHLTLDLLDPERSKTALRTLKKDPPDIWVNNAGHGLIGEVWTASDDEITAIRRLLYDIPVELTRFFETLCRTNRSRPSYLIQVSSLATELPIPSMPYYNAAKAALSAFTQSLLLDGHLPFQVIDFRPGDFKTEFMENQTIRSSGMGGSPTHDKFLQRHLSAPDPEKAARTLVRAMRRNHNGILRSGSFFQAHIAPLGPRLLPARLLHKMIRSHYR